MVHDDDLIGELEGLLLVVCHEEAGDAELAVEAVEPVAELLADAGVQCSERFVQQQDLGPRRQGSGKRHPLALAARELIRVSVGEGRQPHQFQQLVDPLTLCRLVDAADRKAEGDVPAHGHVAEQGVVLEDESEAAILDAGVRQLLSRDPHASGVRLLQPGDHPQDGALSGTARSQQSCDGSFCCREAHVVNGLEPTERLRKTRTSMLPAI